MIHGDVPGLELDPRLLLCDGLNVEQICLDEAMAADPAHLLHAEVGRFSQFGEDGVIAEIFRRCGTTSRTFVEIGAADGHENCTRALVEDGWTGVWVEADPARCARARLVVGDRAVRVVEAFVDRDNVVGLCSPGGGAAVDLLVVDVDGNDAPIFEACLAALRPRVCVVEYNAGLGPVADWVMPYDPAHEWQESAFHGASLAALERIGRAAGYALVGCSSEGVNAFFVAADLADRFSAGGSLEHYVSPRHKLPFGHPARPVSPFSAPEVPADEADRIALQVMAPRFRSVRPGGSIYLALVVANETSVPIGSSQEHPVVVATWWSADDGGAWAEEPPRSLQAWSAAPGERALLVARATIPAATAAPQQLWVGLVQEGVRWIPGRGRTKAAGVVVAGRADAATSA